MMLREKARQKSPDLTGDQYVGGVYGCPMHWGFEEAAEGKAVCETAKDVWRELLSGDELETEWRACTTCWDREAKDGGSKK